MEQFNTIPTSGNWSDIAGILDANFLRCYTALVQSESLVGLSGSNFQGIYTSASALPEMSSSGWALVGSSLSALTLYVYNTGSSEWGALNSTTYNFTDFSEFQTQLDALSSQLTQIGSNLDEVERQINGFVGGNVSIPISNDGYFLATGNVGVTAASTPTAMNNYGYVKMSASEGDKFIITLRGGNNARAYAFLDSSLVVLESSRSYGQVTDLEVTAPSGTAFVVFNNAYANEPNPSIVQVFEGTLVLKTTYTSEQASQDTRIDNNAADIRDLQSAVTGYSEDYTKTSEGVVSGYANTNGINQSSSFHYLALTIPENAKTLTYTKQNSTNVDNIFSSSFQGLDGHPAGTYTIDVSGLDLVYLNFFSEDVTFHLAVGSTLEQMEEDSKDYTDAAMEAKMATGIASLYIPHKKILLSGASICQRNGFFEYAASVLGFTGTNISVAGHNIFDLANRLYSSGASYSDQDVLIFSHTHNYDVYTLPAALENYKPSDYEGDSNISEYITTTDHISGTGGFNDPNYTDDELYAIGYDYCIKKWTELCYNLKDTEGYDPLLGKPCQIVLYTYWHDARITFNTAIRKLAMKWGAYLIKDDENIGFSRKKTHPITGAQVSVLHCNGIPWSSKTEVIDGVTYGFHPSGIATSDWSAFLAADAATKLAMLPYIQVKRAGILINFIKDACIGL